MPLNRILQELKYLVHDFKVFFNLAFVDTEHPDIAILISFVPVYCFNVLNLFANDIINLAEDHFRLRKIHHEIEDSMLYSGVPTLKEAVHKDEEVDKHRLVYHLCVLTKHQENHLSRSKAIKQNLHFSLFFLVVVTLDDLLKDD